MNAVAKENAKAVNVNVKVAGLVLIVLYALVKILVLVMEFAILLLSLVNARLVTSAVTVRLKNASMTVLSMVCVTMANVTVILTSPVKIARSLLVSTAAQAKAAAFLVNASAMKIMKVKIAQILFAIAMAEVNASTTENVYAMKDFTANIVKKQCVKITAT
jgi:hypothetical protein